jgi:hypothetical protein
MECRCVGLRPSEPWRKSARLDPRVVHSVAARRIRSKPLPPSRDKPARRTSCLEGLDQQKTLGSAGKSLSTVNDKPMIPR